MKYIQLTKGKKTLVDDKDFEWLSQWKWCCSHWGYVVRNCIKGEKQSQYRMHRQIMKAKKGKQIDHINGNPLDNRRENLRFATQQQNLWNRKSIKHSSIYKGVFWYKRDKLWKAGIKFNNKQIHLGRFTKEHWAAMAYDIAAQNLFGKYAKLNFPLN